MRAAFKFLQQTKGMNRSDMSLIALAYQAEQYPNQLAAEGTSKIVVFPDGSSVIINGWDTDRPQVIDRS